jgi:hypothetical protein
MEQEYRARLTLAEEEPLAAQGSKGCRLMTACLD